MEERRPFCSEVSREADEPMWATASRIDHWLLVEYRGVWGHDALGGSALGDDVKGHLRAQAAARPHTRIVFIRRPERRTRDGLLAYAATSRPGEERLTRWEVE